VCVWWEWWPCCGQRDQTKKAPANSDEDCLIYQIFLKTKTKQKPNAKKLGARSHIKFPPFSPYIYLLVIIITYYFDDNNKYYGGNKKRKNKK
jgi:hypothetical protein